MKVSDSFNDFSAFKSWMCFWNSPKAKAGFIKQIWFNNIIKRNTVFYKGINSPICVCVAAKVIILIILGFNDFWYTLPGELIFTYAVTISILFIKPSTFLKTRWLILCRMYCFTLIFPLVFTKKYHWYDRYHRE